MQVCSGVFTTQYNFLLVGKTLENMHPGWAIALSFIAAGWFGRRSFIRKDSTPTTYGNFWRGIKLVQIPNNAVCLNMHPKQMMYIQLSWNICPKLLQSQAYSEHHTTDTTAGTGTAAHTHLMHEPQGADNYVAEPSMQISWTSTNIHTWCQSYLQISSQVASVCRLNPQEQSPSWRLDPRSAWSWDPRGYSKTPASQPWLL